MRIQVQGSSRIILIPPYNQNHHILAPFPSTHLFNHYSQILLEDYGHLVQKQAQKDQDEKEKNLKENIEDEKENEDSPVIVEVVNQKEGEEEEEILTPHPLNYSFSKMEESNERIKKLSGVQDTILHPGEGFSNVIFIHISLFLVVVVLYIPPFWYYRVENLNISLSLEVSSPSEEQIRLLEAYW